MNRKAFFDSVRQSLFHGKLTQKQVDGLTALLDAAPKNWDPRWLAYCLATAYHETARTMQPIKEYGRGKGRKYGRADPETGHAYYGRGYVQLTWKTNYQKASKKLGQDFVTKPDNVMEPESAARILYKGMKEGWFTGKGLKTYLGPKHTNWKDARRIVNGLDRASQIAVYAKKFHAALKAAQSVSV